LLKYRTGTSTSIRSPGVFIKIVNRDAPGTVFAGYPANPKYGRDTGYPANPKYGYRISGRIFGLTTTGKFLVKNQKNFCLLQTLNKT
jgi:hypothetical protein